MYPKTSPAIAWAALEKAIDSLKLKADKRKPDDGILVTKWKKVTGGRVQFHVFVPPTVEPARVYIGSLSEQGGRLVFSDRLANNSLYTALARDLGVAGDTIPLDASRRMMKSMSLASPNADIHCLRQPVSGSVTGQKIEEISQPDLVSLRKSAQVSQPGTMIIEGYLAEDGYFQPARLVQGNASNQPLRTLLFEVAALARYRPAIANNCGVPGTARFTATWR
jgi:hypothetical protein